MPLFVTRDGGRGWEERRLRPREEVVFSPKQQGGKFWSYVAALAIDPQTPERIYVGLYGAQQPLRTSADAGASWSAIPLPAELRNVTALALGTDRQNLYVATASVLSSYGVEGVCRLRLP